MVYSVCYWYSCVKRTPPSPLLVYPLSLPLLLLSCFHSCVPLLTYTPSCRAFQTPFTFEFSSGPAWAPRSKAGFSASVSVQTWLQASSMKHQLFLLNFMWFILLLFYYINITLISTLSKIPDDILSLFWPVILLLSLNTMAVALIFSAAPLCSVQVMI